MSQEQTAKLEALMEHSIRPRVTKITVVPTAGCGTACPVVWEPRRAQSRRGDPINFRRIRTHEWSCCPVRPWLLRAQDLASRACTAAQISEASASGGAAASITVIRRLASRARWR